MDTIDLSPDVLEWAASQAGEHVESLAKKISKKSAKKITGGTLTYSQILKYAKLAGVPLGSLFVAVPPAPRRAPLADFRTLPDAHPLSRDFFDVFDDIEFKHSWLSERLRSTGADPLEFVGKYHDRWPLSEVLAAEIRSELGFNQPAIKDVANSEELFAFLVERSERKGIYVFKNGVVGNNTRRSLSVSEFRGFVIADPYCPLIFINGADAPAAWVFTLAHELAHIWIGDSGISDTAPAAENRIESFCNAVAGEFLVPKAEFTQIWGGINGQIDEKLEGSRRQFKVSKVVVARRALDLDLIPKAKYIEIYNYARKIAKEKKSSGGDFYRTLAIRNSKTFSLKVANLALSGAITLGQAGRLLNTNPNHVVTLHEKRNAISI